MGSSRAVVGSLVAPATTGTDARWARLLLAVAKSSGVPGASAASRADMEGFEQLFRRHERDIFSYLWRMTGDEHAAYDLTQETFIRAWQHFARLRAYERPGGWLFRVATHLALNHLRGRATLLGSAAPLDAQTLDVAGDLAQQIAEGDAVRRAVMALVPRQRAALVLREVYGLTCGEVAAALGISPGAAKTMLWRAREEFRVRYHQQEERDA